MILTFFGATSTPKGFEKEAVFLREGGAAQVKTEAGLGLPSHRFHRLRGDLTLEKHSPVKKDVSVQRVVVAMAGVPQASAHNFFEGGRVNLKCAPQC